MNVVKLDMILPFEEWTNTPETPKTKQVEETEHLTSVPFASEDSVYELKWKRRCHIH